MTGFGAWRPLSEHLTFCMNGRTRGAKMLAQLIAKFVRRLRRNRKPYMPALILAGC